MENLHVPTVPSGPTSNAIPNGNGSHLSFGELQRKKTDFEEELKALGSVLESVNSTVRFQSEALIVLINTQHGVNMDTPLLTRDGFPRSDIDVPQIRTTRAQIIRLRNDYKDLMANIEKYLHEHFASMEGDNGAVPGGGTSVPQVLPDSHTDGLDEPFAKVNTVAAGSPADHAGLKEGDELRNFGFVNKTNHDNLKKVAECVQGNEGRNIFIKVSRAAGFAQRQELRLSLTPVRDWGGRGMLGCHILQL
ncbi:putative 26S proteasome regulatory subunit [Conoideocrella luteorostrata]|uniref:Probable 26S proteasome regulatory subunit p27 n=1 Tax=Conoideocrella luteorostrata TaxID=1105319 RepID=A0AAJ0CI09_9HYPO|nr:putative 26S proteasome regulatory subunit [Conoideocrella luteorostrata]